MAAAPDASTWHIIESGFRPETLRHYEGAFTLGSGGGEASRGGHAGRGGDEGSGGVHVRGSLEEHLSGAPQDETYWRLPGNVTSEAFRAKVSEWGTFVPGIYGRHPLLNSQIVNLPWFLGLAPVVDGERLDLASSEIHSHERLLDMAASCLTRRTVWRTRSGAKVTIEADRFVSAVRPRLCVQRMQLVSDRDVDLTFVSWLDADVRTNGYDHFVEVELVRRGERRLYCRVRTDAGDEVHTLCESLLVPDGGAAWAAPEDRAALSARAIALAAARRLHAGEPVALEKRTVVTTSRDGADPALRAAAVLDEAVRSSWEHLLGEHREAWMRRWQQADVTVDGDEESQRAVRFSLHHLLRCWPGEDGRLAVDAKGYAGQAYWGRFFWDSEIYLLPFYAHTVGGDFLMRYRLDSLAGARRNAARYGAPGAKYAWEADPAGDECCPNWQYADHEIHISADVVYALVHQARIRGEDQIAPAAAEAAVEIARYCLSRIDFDGPAGRGAAHIRAVMGPDEYTFLRDDNAFTNRMAAFALRAAAEHGASGGASPEECDRFRHAAESLVILRDEAAGTVLQCAGFDELPDPQFELRWKDRTRTFAAQVPQELLYRTKCLKQADALMLPFLFEREWSDDDDLHAAWRAYLPCTTHDSSLSAGVHGVLACRLARAGVAGMDEQAWSFWLMARDIDVSAEARGCEQGIHIANAAALWQMVVYGFAGVGSAMSHDVLTLRPRLPESWNGLHFPLRWRSSVVRIDIERAGANGLSLALHHVSGSSDLPVRAGGQERSIAVGAVGRFTL